MDPWLERVGRLVERAVVFGAILRMDAPLGGPSVSIFSDAGRPAIFQKPALRCCTEWLPSVWRTNWNSPPGNCRVSFWNCSSSRSRFIVSVISRTEPS